MFEKEAKEYAIDAPPPFGIVREAYQKGAEFGYNKANEWHFVENGDLPKEGGCDVWVLFENGNPGIGSFTSPPKSRTSLFFFFKIKDRITIATINNKITPLKIKIVFTFSTT